MKLTLIRHGETIENANHIIQGNLDGTLSNLGIAQAQQVADELSGELFDQAYSSDLGRCVATAEFIVAKHKCYRRFARVDKL